MTSIETCIEVAKVSFILCRDFSKLPKFNTPVIATLGNFDGVHLGHQSLLKRVSDAKKNRSGAILVAISFYPHPSTVIGKEKKFLGLTSLHQKCRYLALEGINVLLLLHFTKSFASILAQDFVDKILIEGLNVDHLVLGSDARVGRARMGSPDFIKEQLANADRTVEIVPFLEVEGAKIGSAGIRGMLISGDVEKARGALGRLYSVEARVMKGDGRGASIGFPTANFLPKEQLLPGNGVYATWIDLNGSRMPSVTNIGTRPTFDGSGIVAETHVLGETIEPFYGKRVEVSFVKKLRDEEKFASVPDLVTQIKLDIKSASAVLGLRD